MYLQDVEIYGLILLAQRRAAIKIRAPELMAQGVLARPLSAHVRGILTYRIDPEMPLKLGVLSLSSVTYGYVQPLP